MNETTPTPSILTSQHAANVDLHLCLGVARIFQLLRRHTPLLSYVSDARANGYPPVSVSVTDPETREVAVIDDIVATVEAFQASLLALAYPLALCGKDVESYEMELIESAELCFKVIEYGIEDLLTSQAPEESADFLDGITLRNGVIYRA